MSYGVFLKDPSSPRHSRGEFTPMRLACGSLGILDAIRSSFKNHAVTDASTGAYVFPGHRSRFIDPAAVFDGNGR